MFKAKPFLVTMSKYGLHIFEIAHFSETLQLSYLEKHFN